jgi:hypothetical protein
LVPLFVPGAAQTTASPPSMGERTFDLDARSGRVIDQMMPALENSAFYKWHRRQLDSLISINAEIPQRCR